jgi:hypothetical protein
MRLAAGRATAYERPVSALTCLSESENLSALVDASSDLNDGNVERIGDRHHGGPGRVRMPALDPREVGDRNASPLGDGFLRHPRFAPQLPDSGTERRLRIA